MPETVKFTDPTGEGAPVELDIAKLPAQRYGLQHRPVARPNLVDAAVREGDNPEIRAVIGDLRGDASDIEGSESRPVRRTNLRERAIGRVRHPDVLAVEDDIERIIACRKRPEALTIGGPNLLDFANDFLRHPDVGAIERHAGDDAAGEIAPKPRRVERVPALQRDLEWIHLLDPTPDEST